MAAQGGEANAGGGGKKADMVEVWPHLVFIELIAMTLVTAGLIAFSLVVEAPLEGIADPAYTPAVAKAPWYFVGLQELLVYFDPWIAGVMVPGIIIVGLMMIPYLDRNPVGTGRYAFRKRPVAWTAFLFGTVLWFVLIAIGEFTRGPHWAWYWPGESWDVQRPAEPPTWDLPLGWGIASLVGYLAVGLALPAWLFPSFRRELGTSRYAVSMLLLLGMLAIPLKIVLRLVFDIHYVVATDWFNI
jgi:hypothetical protein